MNKKNLVRLGVLFCLTMFSGYLFKKSGYIPPLEYFFSSAKSDTRINSVSSSSDLLNYQKPIADLVSSIDKSQTAILIEKSLNRLTIYYRERPLKSYPVVFGSNPVGDKLREGDRKTPEGVFKIGDLYPHARWSKFIWIDYPNQESWRKHLQAKKQRVIPVSASIGGEIGIHGVNRGANYLIDKKNNWTLGCISLKNSDVDEIYSIVEVGTGVNILP